ncbi:MAG: LysM peptidoglycan-binding domain-containing protein [Caldilineaceae bacterium]
MIVQDYTTQEVICSRCHRVVHINPDRTRCEYCEANLQLLIAPDVARAYFYGRAQRFFETGEVSKALAEANRGLNQYNDSELRLLAAILSRQLGDQEQMRIHVAAIPIDDRLRKEAEWLLRSQYSPERKRQRIETLATTTPTQPQSQTHYGTILRLALGVVVSCMIVYLAWSVWQQVPLVSLNTPVTPLPEATAIPNATETLVPLPIPTLENNQAIVDQTDDAIAALGPQALVDGSQPYDLGSALTNAGLTQLAALPIQARQNGTALQLIGTVASVEERTALTDFAKKMEGISEVDALSLQVRTPATYTVQSGDSLWTIGFKFYGDDSRRIAQIFEANRNQMNSANDLRVGMVLNLPPFE